jgi:hypothetical protein
MYPVVRWFCCLTAEDKAAVTETAALFVTSLYQPIPSDFFDAAWVFTLLYTSGKRDAVLELYGLEDTFIYIPDGPPVPAVGITIPSVWDDIVAFLIAGGGDCALGCDAPTWSIQ